MKLPHIEEEEVDGATLDREKKRQEGPSKAKATDGRGSKGRFLSLDAPTSSRRRGMAFFYFSSSLQTSSSATFLSPSPSFFIRSRFFTFLLFLLKLVVMALESRRERRIATISTFSLFR